MCRDGPTCVGIASDLAHRPNRPGPRRPLERQEGGREELPLNFLGKPQLFFESLALGGDAHRPLHAFSHAVHGVGQLAQLVASPYLDPVVEIPGCIPERRPVESRYPARDGAGHHDPQQAAHEIGQQEQTEGGEDQF